MMNYYAQGGLHRTSHYIKSKGRGRDTELVHMTPGEIKGLRALAMAHGGDLTINPSTGLPEAGFLENILPVVAAAGLTYLTAGAAAPVLSAAMGSTLAGGIAAGAGAGALISGGFAAAQGKDVGNAALMGGLGGAISGGLGAYDGAATADMFTKGATDATTSSATNVAASAAPATNTGVDIAGNAVSMPNPAGSGFISGETGQALNTPLSPLNIGDVEAQAGGFYGGQAPANPYANMTNQQIANATGIQTPQTSPTYYSGLKPDQYIQKAAIQALPAASLLEDKQSVPGYQEDEYDRRLKGYKLSSNYKAYEAPRPNPYYRASYAAEGGVMSSFDDEAGVDMAEGGKILMPKLKSDFGIAADSDPSTRGLSALDAAELRNKKLMGRFGIKTAETPKAGIKSLGGNFSDTAARGGIADLGGYSDGGRMLKGPGDGMSDSIPGVIGGKQPARLADGEFVVPADVVSHLGNGSTDAGAKKLYGMMDKIRQARTGRKKQAPQVNVDKYLPMNKKASGGIAGYASGGVIGYAEGGEIASVYESYLGRTPSAAEIKSWQDTGASYNTISQGIRNSAEAKTFASNAANAEKIVTSLYQDQLGRAPDPEGLKFWSESLAKGTPLQQISQGINQSLEGQNFDTQYITSLYRQNLARNPEQAGYQYWLSEAQAAGYTPKEIEAILKQAATPEQAVRNITPGKNATEMELAALESDPFGGRYATKSIYDLLPDAVNVSSIGEQKAQFVNPVTQQPYVTNYGQGTFSQSVGKEILNQPQVQAAITVARNNGTLNQSGYDALMVDLNSAKTAEQTRAALAKPQAQVVVDALRGQQIGEDVNLAAARTEGTQRQGVLSAQDPGYYQSNPVLSAAYQQAGLTVPFDYGAYKNVDTRSGQANLFTPQNFQNKQNELVNTLNRNDPYRTSYQPINRGITNMPLSVQDPYSDAGLKVLYGQMMDQYGPPPANFVNPATFTPNRPYTYIPPTPDNLVLSTPIPDASTAAANQAKADAVTAANVVAPSGASGERAGGLLSMDRKKRAKPKYKT